ncbi:bifunctional nicotinamidase/pyrazinamidase [soil metagenome]
MASRYDTRTALIVVDVQNDFADPDGALSVAAGEVVVRAVNVELEAARNANATIAYTQDWHPPSTSHFATDGGTWPVHCVQGTWGAPLHPDLLVAGQVVRKGSNGEDGYSGFTMRDPLTHENASTGRDEALRDRGIERAVVVGLALDVCVKETALDARRLGYGCSVVRDASAPVEMEAGDGDRACAELTAAGVDVR